MSRSLFSQSWYRVKDLRPRLRSHAEIQRQRFRGQVWYVLQDHVSGRFHRFSPLAQHIIGLMDGKRTVGEIWAEAAERLGEDLPPQDEVVQLLSQLYAADVLHFDVRPDIAELWRRSDRDRRQTLLNSIRNPMAVRLPLLDPDRFLVATMGLVRPIFTWWGLLVWCAVVVAGAVLAGIHWSELTGNLSDRVFAADNVLILVLVYPVIKAIHELGHGYATRIWGGEVHEIGLMFLVFVPVPYVDASASTAFRSKWQRATVGAAGIFVELFLAALAMIVWVHVEPGWVRAVAFNVMLIGGVSTVLFNGNPLLRFDGYYVLSDLIEIPNLASRANRYILYLVQRRLLDITEVTLPAYAPGERAWFLAYGSAAFLYRLFIMTAIALFVASEFFFVGVILAIWAITLLLLVPIGKGVWFLAKSPRLHRRRLRALAVSGGAAAVVACFLFVVPIPFGTVVQGVVWIPERAKLYAGADGIVAAIRAQPDTRVRRGEPLIELEAPVLLGRIAVLEGELAGLEAEFDAALVGDRVRADVLRERIRLARERLLEAKREADALTVRSPADGRFLLPGAADLTGRFVRRGDLVAYVVEDAVQIVRVVVPQSAIDLVRRRTESVAVRAAAEIATVLPARIINEVPGARESVTIVALTTEGGGSIRLDPTDAEMRAFEHLMQLDLEVPGQNTGPLFGGRVYVRFDHGAAPIAGRVYLRLRQLFLSRFNV